VVDLHPPREHHPCKWFIRARLLSVLPWQSGRIRVSSGVFFRFCIYRISIFSLEGWLDGLPLRVFNEGSPRPRVAQAQETV